MDKNEVLIEKTADESHTLFVPHLNEHYHSVNGAIQESIHVFIEAGLNHCSKKEISILEIGFGTGLNAYLTLLHAIKIEIKIFYWTVETYPLPVGITDALNYAEQISGGNKDLFKSLHQAEWETDVEIVPEFYLKKIQTDFSLLNYEFNKTFDLVFFDAFAPDKQITLWKQEIFDQLFSLMNDESILVTYCAKGEVRRMLKASGFQVERLPGPPGKREMLRCVKNTQV